MNKEISDRIKIASFLCTIMVLFRHSLNHVAFWGEWRGDILAGIIEGGFSTATEIAVPYFFLVSGFFFFKHSYYEKKAYLTMLKKKGYTLLIPYLIWSIIGLIEQVVAGQYHKTDFHDILHDLVLSEWNGPLWYVRTLIVFMILVPLYGWIYSLKNKIVLVVTLLVVFYIWRTVDCSVLSTEGMMFFLLGGLLSYYEKHLEYKINVKSLYFLLALWLTISFIQPFWISWVHKSNTLLGIFTFWQLLPKCSVRFKSVILSLSGLSFFVYVNHVYPLKAIKLTIASLYPQNEIAALIVYFIAPIIVLVVFLFIGNLMRRYTPNILNIITGGRK